MMILKADNVFDHAVYHGIITEHSKVLHSVRANVISRLTQAYFHGKAHQISLAGLMA